MGKILVDGGSKNVPVGKVIALLAEEGDDLNNLEAPEEGGAAKPAAEESAPKSESPKEEKSEAPKAAEAEQSTPKESAGHSEIDSSISIFPAAERL